MGALNLVAMKSKESGTFGTAKNVTELVRNYVTERSLNSDVPIDPNETNAVEAVVRDLLANRFSVIIGRIEREMPSEKIKEMLLDILK